MKKLIAAVLLCASLVICALILVRPNIILRNAGGISVKGYAVERVQSDAASWNASISAIEKSEAAAYAKVKKSASAAKEFLLKNGAKEDKLIFSAITVTPNFKLSNGTRTNDIENYHASVSISYCDTDVDAVVKIADTAPELIEQGVSIFSPTPEYYYTKLEDLKISLIERAAANAKLRAQRLTSGTNSNLGKILSASQGIFQITRPLSNETSDWGIYDTSSREKDVRCVVTIEFAIDK